MSARFSPKLVIFDCDGVLVDSERLAASVFVGALADFGLRLGVDEAIGIFAGLTAAEDVTIAEGMLGRKLPDDFWPTMQARTYEVFEDELQPVTGARALVKAFVEKDIRVCVASSGAREKMKLTLGVTGLASLFGPDIFSAEEVGVGKPAPDLFLYAARRMGFPPDQCLVIEDSLPGIEAALAARMPVILLDTDGRFPESVKDVVKVANLSQVHELTGFSG